MYILDIADHDRLHTIGALEARRGAVLQLVGIENAGGPLLPGHAHIFAGFHFCGSLQRRARAVPRPSYGQGDERCGARRRRHQPSATWIERSIYIDSGLNFRTRHRAFVSRTMRDI